MIRALALAAALGAAGCAAPDAPADPSATPPAPSAEAAPSAEPTPAAPMPSGPVTVRLGASAAVAGRAVRFEAVVEDSRCPEGVSCIQAGRAQVRVAVGAEAAVLTLRAERLRDGEAATAVLDGLTVTVEALRPYPGSAEAQAGAPVEAVLAVADAE